MPREPDPSTNNREFILEALQQNIRLDGRAQDQCRDLSISFGEEPGLADVRLGETRVLTKVSASLASPYPDRKFDGIFTVTAELSPLASPAFEVGRPSDLEAHLTSTLDTLIRRSNAISTESLCLIAGERVWHLRATLHVLSHKGSLLTCSSISLLAALLHYRIPSSEVRGGALTVFNTRQRDPVPLTFLHHALCAEMAIFKFGNEALGETRVVVHPSLEEEQVSHGSVLVGGNQEGEVILIEKKGGVDVEGIILLKYVDQAFRQVKGLLGKVFAAIAKDAKQRDLNGLISRELRAENER